MNINTIGDLGSLTWDSLMNSDLSFKSDSIRKIVELKGEETGLPDETIIMLYFNHFDGSIMIIVAYVPIVDYKPNIIGLEDFIVNVDPDEDNPDLTVISAIKRELQEAIEAEEGM